MDYTNVYYQDAIGSRVLPNDIYEFGKLSMSNPEIMAIFSGLQITFGEDVLLTIKELLEDTKNIVPICSNMELQKCNLEQRESDMRAVDELLRRKKEVIKTRIGEISEIEAEFKDCLERMDTDGMSVCSKLLVAKNTETESDSGECATIVKELDSYTKLFNDASDSYNKCKKVLDDSTMDFSEQLETLAIKDLTKFKAFCEFDNSVFLEIVQNGVNAVNTNLASKFGGKLQAEEVLEKNVFILELLAGFYGSANKLIEYMKGFLVENKMELGVFDTKVAKRHITVLNSFGQYLNGEFGVKYVLAYLPTKLRKEQIITLKLYNDYLKDKIQGKKNIEFSAERDKIFDYVKKNNDPLTICLVGAMNELDMVTLSVSNSASFTNTTIEEDDLVHKLLNDADIKRFED